MRTFEPITRQQSAELDEILGVPFPVLDDGFIRVIDYMGNDSAVVQAARVSYGAGTKTLSSDRNLIDYLIRHRHTTPFEMCEIKLHIRIPMDAWRQMIRTRTANVNEYSTRYSEAIDSMQGTKPNQWRLQSTDNKQGSDGFLSESEGVYFSMDEQTLQEQAVHVYKSRLKAGIAREQARKDLPLSTYTEAYWKIDLHNLLHFLELRMDSHAQYEIRQYANTIGEIVEKWCPLVWESFVKHRVNSVTLSEAEIEAVPDYIAGTSQKEYYGLSKSEYKEFEEKMRRMGL